MEMCEEMAKLRELLTAKGIKWRDHSVIQQEKLIEYLSAESGMEKEFFDTTIYRTHFDYKGSHYDDNDPVGWLTAQEIIDSLDMTRQQ